MYEQQVMLLTEVKGALPETKIGYSACWIVRVVQQKAAAGAGSSWWHLGKVRQQSDWFQWNEGGAQPRNFHWWQLARQAKHS
jgi:hypothetical protein